MPGAAITLVPVTIGDEDLLTAWFAADAEGAAHLGFYRDVRAWLPLLSVDRLGWIAHTDGHPVGFLDLEMSGDAGHLSYYAAPGFRRRGYGAALLRAATAQCELRGVRRAVGASEPGNTASLAALLRAGFTVSAQPDDEGMHTATAILPGQ